MRRGSHTVFFERDEEQKMYDLPKLTAKQNQFVLSYLTNGNNATQAYKAAYDTSNMQDETVHSEASKLLKNEKIQQWIEHSQIKQQEVIEEELKYTAKEAFNEFESLQVIALRCKDNNSNPLIGEARKMIENKCKLAGLYKDNGDMNVGITNVMPSVTVNGEELDFGFEKADK